MMANVHLFPTIIKSNHAKSFNEGSFDYKKNEKLLFGGDQNLNKLKYYFKNLSKAVIQNFEKYPFDEENKKSELNENSRFDKPINKQVNNDENSKEYNRFEIFDNIENYENDDTYDKNYKDLLTLYSNDSQLIEKFFKFESYTPTIDELNFEKLGHLSIDDDPKT